MKRAIIVKKYSFMLKKAKSDKYKRFKQCKCYKAMIRQVAEVKNLDLASQYYPKQ